jgi:short subunit fatty acids transporter
MSKNIYLFVFILVLVVAVTAMMITPDTQAFVSGYWTDGFCNGSASGSCGLGGV